MSRETIAKLLLTLKQLDISLKVQNNQLKVFNEKGHLTRELLTQLKTRKQEIIDFLTNTGMISFDEIPCLETLPSYETSHTQKRLWFLQQLENAKTAYNVPGVYRILGDLDVSALQCSLNAIMIRHEILRTTFKQENGRIRQIVHQNMSFQITVIDLINVPQQQEKIQMCLQQNLETVFDLSQFPLFRFQVIMIEPKETLIAFNIHHIICDERSLQIFFDEFFLLYRKYANGTEEELQPLKIQYKDYASWNNQLLNRPGNSYLKEYWHNKLSGQRKPLALPYDYRKPSLLSYVGKTVRFPIPTAQTRQIKKFSREQSSSLFNTLLMFTKILLYRITNQAEIIVGTPVLGRNHVELEKQIGCYFNIVVLKDSLDGAESSISLLKKVQLTTTTAFDHQMYPFDKLVSELETDRTLNKNPLFDMMVVLQEKQPTYFEINDLQVFPLPICSGVSRFELTFSFFEDDDQLHLNIEYLTDLFSEDTIVRIWHCFFELMTDALRNPDCPIADLNMVTKKDLVQIDQFNRTASRRPELQSILPLLAQKMTSMASQVAWVSVDGELTYQALQSKAKLLSSFLRQKFDIQPNDVVAIIDDSDEWMIVGIVAILMSGAAYLPISNRYPENRVQFMLADSNCKLLLTKNVHWVDRLGKVSIPVLVPDNSLTVPDIPMAAVKGSDLAYVMYTSGSTGKPKGVMIEHKSLLNTLLWFIDQYGIHEQSRVLSMTAFTFDVSVEEFFSSLMVGATLYRPPQQVCFNRHQFIDYLKQHQIEIIQFVPATLNELLSYEEKVPSLHTVICGGESLPDQLKDKIIDKGYKLYNHYGPTECTVDALAARCHRQKSVNVGKPITNMQAYVLNYQKCHQPIKILGELHLSGVGLARGYVNAPQTTADQFIANPFYKGQSMYCTGDLARWLPDGNIELFGRIDRQIKLRGFRINPEEIESYLCQNPLIANAAVITKKIKERKTLIAYITARQQGKKLSRLQIQNYLSTFLPNYLIPTHFIWLDSMPLTENGKLDYQKLPDVKSNQTSKKSSVPQTDIQKKILSVWQQVLNRDNIVATDNFFEIGGDSIKAIQIISNLHQLDLSLEIKDIFNYPTIISLSEHVKPFRVKVKQDLVWGKVPLTPIQSWFEKEFFSKGERYHQSVLLHFERRLHLEFVRKVFTEIITHHDELRAFFVMNSDSSQLEQYISKEIPPIDIDMVDQLTSQSPDKELKNHAADLHHSILLKQCPLIRMAIYRRVEGDFLLIIIHHLIVDGVSWRILMEDFMGAYEQISQNNTIHLPFKTNAYKEWAEHLLQFSKSRNLLQEEKYWYALSTVVTEQIPVDFQVKENLYQDQASVISQLSVLQTEDLLYRSHHAYHTHMEDMLLTALAKALNNLYDINNVLLYLEGHGRENIIGLDISRTVGWFTSRYPVILNCHNPNLDKHIIEIKENLRRIPHKGIGFGILQYLTPGKYKKFPPFNISSQIEFNYLGQFDTDTQSQPFKIIQKSTGTGIEQSIHRPVALEINAVVIANQLQITITYNQKQFKTQTIQKLIDAFKSALTDLVAFCSTRKESEKTASDFHYNQLNQEEFSSLTRQHGYFPNNIKEITRLSPIQEGIFFHNVLEPSSSVYFEQMSMSLSGHLCPETFKKTWSFLIERHDMLRANYVHMNVSTPLQVFFKERSLDSCWVYENLKGDGQNQQQSYLEAVKLSDRKRYFNLSADMLIRIYLYKLDSTQYYIIFSNHHIILDGWSINILFEEFLRIYNALMSSNPIDLPPAFSYNSYLEWMNKKDLAAAKLFWQNYLKDYQTPVSVIGKTLNENPTHSVTKFIFEIADPYRRQLIALNRTTNITLFAIIQALWGVILSKYNETDDVVFGVVVSVRPPEIEGIETATGMFMNTVPVRIKDLKHKTFIELATDIQSLSIQRVVYQHFPLYEILKTNALREKLFDHILVYENYPVAQQIIGHSSLRPASFKIENIEMEEQTNYDLVIEIRPDDPLTFILAYNDSVYEKHAVKQIESHLQNILDIIFSQGEHVQISDIDLINREEKRKIRSYFASDQETLKQVMHEDF